jgi:hypothetical protein
MRCEMAHCAACNRNQRLAARIGALDVTSANEQVADWRSGRNERDNVVFVYVDAKVQYPVSVSLT